MTPFDRSVAFWLRAYPRRWRAARTAEITAVLTDLAEPGARRLDARAAAGLVRGGWATRRREHPPLGMWVRYYAFAPGRTSRLPSQFDGWVRDERTGALTLVRACSLLFLAMCGILTGIEAAARGFGRISTTSMAVWAVWLAIAVWQAPVVGRRRHARIAAYFPRPPDPAMHFGNYVPMRRALTAGMDSSAQASRRNLA